MECTYYSLGTVPADVIEKTFTEPYPMELVGADRDLMFEMVNQGIDAHLEAFTESQFDDRYDPKDIRFRISGPRLFCTIGPKDMPVLLRRLKEAYERDPEEPDPNENHPALSLRQAILSTMGIEEE